MAHNTSPSLSAPDDAFETSASLVAEALGQQITARFTESSLGVSVESPPQFDPEWLINALDRASERRIGLVMVNIDELDIDAVQAATSETSIRVSDDLATAIKWRNEEPTGFTWEGDHVPDRIVVLFRGDPARMNSLHRLYNIPLGEIRDGITSIMAARPEFRDNPSVQDLWETIGNGRTTSLSIEAVATYSINTLRSSQQASIEALGTELNHLGLFPDANILTGDIEARLQDNDDAVSRVLHLTNRDRRRLMNSIQKEHTQQAQEQQAKVVELLRRYQRTHDDAILSELSFTDVKSTLETTSQSVARSGTTGGAGEGESPESGSESGGGRRYDRRYDDSSVGVELAFENEDDELQAIAERLDEGLSEQLDKDEDRTEITFRDDSKVVIDIDPDIYRFIQRFVDAETFGGIIRDVEDRTEALENIGSLSTTKFRPDSEDSGITKLRAFARRHDEFESVLTALDRYFEARAGLIDALPQLIHSPLLALLGDDDRLAAATEYLDAYQAAQRQLDTHHRTLQDASASGAAQLLSEFLLFDMIIIETDHSREMLLSPLHPLQLWKYVRLASAVSEENTSLSDDEQEFLQKSVDEQPHVLNNLSIGGGRYLDEEIYLIQSDELTRLPVYTEADQAEPGTNAELWDYLIEKFTAAYPPAHSRLKLTVVDPLAPSGLLHAISSAAQEGLLNGGEIEFCYVESTPGNILSGATSSEEEDILTVFGPRSDFSGFTVQTRDARSYESLADTFTEHPQHCVVINDNGAFQIEEFERDPNTSIHPLYVPKEFKYDEFEQELRIRASTEGELFSEFQDLINQLFNTRTTLRKAGVHNLTITESVTQQFLDASIWTVLSTPATNIDPFWESNLIAKERRGARNYGIYSRDFELFTRTLNRLLQEYPIATDEIETTRLARRIADLQNSGLLRLITEETLGQNQSNNTQGLLGSVIALQWLEEQFENPKLIFSIDDPQTRRWLNFGDDNRRADFLVAQLTDDTGIELTVVEVKTLSEPDSAFQIDESTTPPRASGSAVEQVTDTVTTIRQLFETPDNITKQPRREALREQLYYELVGRDVGDYKDIWADGINSVFRGDAELRVHPAIVSVELNNPADSATRQECTTDTAHPVDITRLPRRTVTRMVLNGVDDESHTRDDVATATREETSADPDVATHEPTPEEEITATGSESTSDDTETSATSEADVDDTDTAPPAQSFGDREEYAGLTEDLKRILSEFGISVREVPNSEIDVGPNVIRYKIELSPGEQQSQLNRHAEDIARELALDHEPIIHRLSGTSYVAVDIPRSDRETVTFEEYVDHLPSTAEIDVGDLPYIAGIEPAGTVKIADLQDAPHMLVGGATGSGKTVFL